MAVGGCPGGAGPLWGMSTLHSGCQPSPVPFCMADTPLRGTCCLLFLFPARPFPWGLSAPALPSPVRAHLMTFSLSWSAWDSPLSHCPQAPTELRMPSSIHAVCVVHLAVQNLTPGLLSHLPPAPLHSLGYMPADPRASISVLVSALKTLKQAVPLAGSLSPSSPESPVHPSARWSCSFLGKL